jgi:hypothetical protein
MQSVVRCEIGDDQMKALTVFTWGYWGWGSHTSDFVKRARRIERARGWKSPIFVDIRKSRAVRAHGFSGDAFNKACGTNGYVWMPKLGNQRIAEGKGGIKISDPGAARDLFDLIVRAAQSKRRVIFFCACEYPGRCHRFQVATLLKKEARRRGFNLNCVEWPGGEPTISRIDVQDNVINRVIKNGTRIPLPPAPKTNIDAYFSLPWFSRVLLCSPKKQIAVIAGPAKPDWYLPILGPRRSREADTVRSLAREAAQLRRSSQR